MLELIKQCPLSGKVTTMKLDIDPYEYFERYLGGTEPVQKVFPWLTADEREFLITGIAPGVLDESFGTEE